jgi:glycosyltransferase involved in cell wall biosynthesis
MMTGLVAWFCERNHRQFIFRTAHDTDCIRNKQLIRFWRDRKLYEYGLKRAGMIAVQGIKQQRLLKENYNLYGAPVNMAVEIPKTNDSKRKDIDILWVNNLRPFKRPEFVIEIAKKMPQYKFVMIGGPCTGFLAYYKKIENQAKRVKNLKFVGSVPYSKINSYFQQSKLFVNTSYTEGFPNSFLQAWIRSVPVITFFDPDNLIKKKMLGIVPSNSDEMELCLDALMNDDKKRRSLGENAKRFANEHYSPDKVVNTYIKLLKKLQ